jgi:hypothetical protein
MGIVRPNEGEGFDKGVFFPGPPVAIPTVAAV